MKILLVVLFMVNGEPALIDGYMPREQPSMEVCAERAEFMADYFATVPDLPEVGEIACGSEEEIQRRIDVMNDPAA